MSVFSEIRRRPFLVGYAILAAGIIGGFLVNNAHNEQAREAVVESSQATAIVGCNRDFVQIKGLRSIIRDQTATIDQYVAEGTLTPAQGERAKHESKKSLHKQPLPDCRVPLTILTSDPDEDIFIPEPLYPKR